MDQTWPSLTDIVRKWATIHIENNEVTYRAVASTTQNGTLKSLWTTENS